MRCGSFSLRDMERSQPDKKAEVRAWRQQVVRARSPLGARFDQAAWSVAAQREPWRWSWPRALVQLAVLLVLGAAIPLVTGVSWTLPLSLALVCILYVARARRLHRHYVAEHGGRGAGR